MDRTGQENDQPATRTVPPSRGDPGARWQPGALAVPPSDALGGSASSRPRRQREPSIRIRRPSSVSSFDRQSAIENVSDTQNNVQPPELHIPLQNEPAPSIASTQNQDDLTPVPSSDEEAWQANRRRSSSEPYRGRFTSPPPAVYTQPTNRRNSNVQTMSPVQEETATQFRPSMDLNTVKPLPPLPPPEPSADQGSQRPSHSAGEGKPRSILRKTSRAALSAIGRKRASTTTATPTPTGQHDLARDEYDSRIVDLLDVVDPEVSTLSTLTNVQNSLFVPDLGRLLNRQPTYNLTRQLPIEETTGDVDLSRLSIDDRRRVSGPSAPLFRQDSIRSVLGEEAPFAVLPDGTTLEGWTIADVEELNDHVRHMLHSRRSKFKRSMKGFGQYIKKPLGFLVTLYATLITLFGLAWVLFLIGWINVGGRQLYVINVIDNVLVALFAIMGDGLAPFRAVDTYHMIYIAHYHHLTWKLRKKKALPKLQNKNDLPSRCPPAEVDLERDGNGEAEGAVDGQPGIRLQERSNSDSDKIEKRDDDFFEFSVLSIAQQRKLEHHSKKFSKSHTFYKPHETTTHYAFPLRLLVVIVVLLDFHSIFQIALGTCTWSISYHVRPFALTTVILCCSITCNITAGILISVGDRRTRKTEVVKRMFRQELTQEAIKKMEKRRKREEQRNEELELERQGPKSPNSPKSPSSAERPEPYPGT